MSPGRPRTQRALAVLAAVVALVGGVGVAASVESSDAAWTDQTVFSAPVTAGTWTPPPPPPPATGCVWYVGGAPQPGASCVITGGSFNQWSNGLDVVRDYSVVVAVTGGQHGGYARIVVDLSTISGTGAWSWTNAATIGGPHLTPLPGYECSELPILRADSPAGWTRFGTNYEIRIVQDKNVGMGSNRTCA